MSWMDVGAANLRYGNGRPAGGGAPKASITAPAGGGITGGASTGISSGGGPALQSSPAKPLQSTPAKPGLLNHGLNALGNASGVRTAVQGARFLGGAAAAPAGLAMTGLTTAIDAVRTPFALATGRDSLQGMHQRDLGRMNSYGSSLGGRALGYSDAMVNNIARPVASTLALADSAIDTIPRAIHEDIRGNVYNRLHAQNQGQRASQTQQAMQQGTATRQQLADATTAAREERKAMQPSGWNPLYWGL